MEVALTVVAATWNAILASMFYVASAVAFPLFLLFALLACLAAIGAAQHFIQHAGEQWVRGGTDSNNAARTGFLSFMFMLMLLAGGVLLYRVPLHLDWFAVARNGVQQWTTVNVTHLQQLYTGTVTQLKAKLVPKSLHTVDVAHEIFVRWETWAVIAMCIIYVTVALIVKKKRGRKARRKGSPSPIPANTIEETDVPARLAAPHDATIPDSAVVLTTVDEIIADINAKVLAQVLFSPNITSVYPRRITNSTKSVQPTVEHVTPANAVFSPPRLPPLPPQQVKGVVSPDLSTNTSPSNGSNLLRGIDMESVGSYTSSVTANSYADEVYRARSRAAEARKAARAQRRLHMLKEIASAAGETMDSDLIQPIAKQFVKGGR